jgi:DNA-binding response OmpR family regulator
MAERILVADDDPVLRALITAVLEGQGYEVHAVPSGDALIRAAHDLLPDLLLVDVLMPVMDGLEAIRQLRNDTRTSHLPMLLITAQTAPHQAVMGLESGADDYITKPFDNDLLVARVRANLRRAARMPVNSPLTGLPGNLLVEEEVIYRLRNNRAFGLLWADIDNFKSFNDAYGFARGDRVIRLVGDLITDVKRERTSEDDFISHIGGDDFVIVTAPDGATPFAERLIERFDAEIGALYDPEDFERGYLPGIDRFGTPRRFSIVSLSIGIVDASQRRFESYDEVSAVAAEVKSFAKKTAGSSYAVDERRLSAASVSTDRRGQAPLVVFACANEERCERILAGIKQTGSRILSVQTNETAGALTAHHPDLVVLDTGLPNVWPVLDELRVSAPGLPVVVVVGRDGEEMRAIAAGARAALPASVTVEQSTAAISDLLRLTEV